MTLIKNIIKTHYFIIAIYFFLFTFTTKHIFYNKRNIPMVDSLQIDKIVIDINKQELYLTNSTGKVIIDSFPISTSKFGEGSTPNSKKTPLGKHKIVNKIGNNAPVNTIFKSRINTGRIAKIHSDNIFRETDLVTTRILRLQGLEEDKNTTSYNRYIYIHGTPEEGMIGKKASHGCIRMKNRDIIKVFELVNKNTTVDIKENWIMPS